MSTNPEAPVDRLRRAEQRLRAATVCVLGGGTSGEEAVSRASADRITAAFRQAAEGDERGPASVRRVDIDRRGAWLVEGRPLAPPQALRELQGVDLFVLGLHGGEGEDGTLQGFLRTARVRHTGTGVGGSAVAMDKVFARTLLEAAGVAVPRGQWLDRASWRGRRDAHLDPILALGESGGWVVKPRCGGSSLAASLVREAADLAPAIERALEEEPCVLVEELVAGVEVTGAVLEGPRGPEALPVVEIQPRSAGFFDYEEKYSEGGAIELCPAASLRADEEDAVRAAALTAHGVLRAEGYSRSDFLVPRTGERAGTPVFLELNTLPGMTERSLLPLAAAAAGLDYRSLCLRIAALALCD